MSKLLNKPLRANIVFTCIVLALSIPAYFFLLESIWIDELDDHNEQIKKQIEIQFNKPSKEGLNERIELWNGIQNSSRIYKSQGLKKDSLYLVEREIKDDGKKELERFRGLKANLRLNGEYYVVVIETNVEEVHETVFSILKITCIFIVLLVAGFTILSRRLSKKIWSPFIDTVAQIKAFDLNNIKSIRFSETDIEEFQELNSAISRLIDNNVATYRQQKEFTQNASHELQTPLAILKSKLDLLIQDSSLTLEQRTIIEELDQSVARVTRINKNLLLLARIENKEYSSESVNLSEIVNSTVRIFSDLSGQKNIIASLIVEKQVVVEANTSLVEILISNLVSNALRHGGQNSKIQVVLSGRNLVVSNEGTVSLEPNGLFSRFASVNRLNPGSGLGLAIAKEICDKYGWRIVYDFSGNRHVFSVQF